MLSETVVSRFCLLSVLCLGSMLDVIDCWEVDVNVWVSGVDGERENKVLDMPMFLIAEGEWVSGILSLQQSVSRAISLTFTCLVQVFNPPFVYFTSNLIGNFIAFEKWPSSFLNTSFYVSACLP